ncbi:MAG: hypothetical protein WD467_02375 [Candidatus Saccharimonadales bacterium]
MPVRGVAVVAELPLHDVVAEVVGVDEQLPQPEGLGDAFGSDRDVLRGDDLVGDGEVVGLGVEIESNAERHPLTIGEGNVRQFGPAESGGPDPPGLVLGVGLRVTVVLGGDELDDAERLRPVLTGGVVSDGPDTGPDGVVLPGGVEVEVYLDLSGRYTGWGGDTFGAVEAASGSIRTVDANLQDVIPSGVGNRSPARRRLLPVGGPVGHLIRSEVDTGLGDGLAVRGSGCCLRCHSDAQRQSTQHQRQKGEDRGGITPPNLQVHLYPVLVGVGYHPATDL